MTLKPRQELDRTTLPENQQPQNNPKAKTPERIARSLITVRQQLQTVSQYLAPEISARLLKEAENTRTEKETAELQKHIEHAIKNQTFANKLQLQQILGSTEFNLTTKYSLEQFDKLSLAQQKQVISNLETQQQNIQNQLNAFYKITNSNKTTSNHIIREAVIHAAKESTNASEQLLATIKLQEQAWQKICKNPNWQNISASEQKKLQKQFNNLSLESRKTLIETIQERLNDEFQIKEYNIFLELQKNYPSINITSLDDFIQASKIDRTRKIATAHQAVVTYIQNGYKSHLAMFPPQDQLSIQQILPNPKLTVAADLPFWVQAIPSQIKKAQDYQSVRSQLPEEAIAYFQLDQKYLFEIHQLITSGVLLRYVSEKQRDRAKTFSKNLEKTANVPNLPLPLYTKEEQKELKTKFDELSFKDQLKATEILLPPAETSKRQQVINQLTSLPQHIQTEVLPYLQSLRNFAAIQLIITRTIKEHTSYTQKTKKVFKEMQQHLTKEELLHEQELAKSIGSKKYETHISRLRKTATNAQSTTAQWQQLCQHPNFKSLDPREQSTYQNNFTTAKLTEKPTLIKVLAQELNTTIPSKQITTKENENDILALQKEDLQKQIDQQTTNQKYSDALQTLQKLQKITSKSDLATQIKLDQQQKEITKLKEITDTQQDLPTSPLQAEIEQTITQVIQSQQQNRLVFTRLAILNDQLQEQNPNTKSATESKQTMEIDLQTITNQQKNNPDPKLLHLQANPTQAIHVTVTNKGKIVSFADFKKQKETLQQQIRTDITRKTVAEFQQKHPHLNQATINQLTAKVTNHDATEDLVVDLSYANAA